MKAFLAGCIIAVFVAGVTAALTYDDPGIDASAAQADLESAQGQAVRPGEARLQGSAESLSIEGRFEDDAPLLGPLTFEASERGLGSNGAVIVSALVNGERATISWDTGRPLVIDGPGLTLERTIFVFDGNGPRIEFADSAHRMNPGTHVVSTPVAVTIGNQSNPRDRVEFEADAETAITFTGTVFLRLPDVAPKFVGPGQLGGQGSFSLTTTDGEREVSRFVLGPEDFFVLEITPVDDPFQPPWSISVRLRVNEGELLTG